MWSINIISVFVVLSAFLAGFLRPKTLLIAFAKKFYDGHDERKIHKGAAPRLGGLAFTPVIAFSIVLILAINIVKGRGEMINNLEENILEMAFQFCGLILLYLVGIAYDLIGVRYIAKFFVQIFSGILLVVGGLWFNNMYGLLGIYEMSTIIGYLLTILVIVFFTNAINLIDGVDGLASRLSIAAVIVYGISFILLRNYMYAAIAFGTLGVLLPFFYYNVFSNVDKGKKIFIGDTGSLTLGLILSILSIKLLHSADSFTNSNFNPSVLAFAPMLIPCLDVVRVFFRRIRTHKSPFLPDRTHIHHKLMAIGFRSRITMVSILGVSILITIVNLYISQYVNVTVLVIANLFVWIMLNMWITKKIRKIGKENDF